MRTGVGLAAVTCACALVASASSASRTVAATCTKSASDLPDLAFKDTNCDGIDGDAARAVFVSTRGSDSSPGTKARPKKTIVAAVNVASRSRARRQILVEAGTYDVGAGIVVPSNVQIYGGYRSPSWRRSAVSATVLMGRPQAVLVGRSTGVVLQLLRLRASAYPAVDRSVYGLRAVASTIVLERVTVIAGAAVDGPHGTGEGTAGAAGAPGNPGSNNVGALPGTGGAGPGGAGGAGGAGAFAGADGYAGAAGSGTGGGKGGAGGTRNPQNVQGNPGANGGDGATGAAGATGAGGSTSFDDAGETWVGKNGLPGGPAQSGGGGGGGGGGSGYTYSFPGSSGGGPGVGGGGGGAGGTGGTGGGPGGSGGGSFAVYLWGSSITIRESTLSAGSGGRGGDGRPGAPGGLGGSGAIGGVTGDGGDGGKGGRGGDGGSGGSGGGGAGGPSVGVFQGASSRVALRRTAISVGVSGAGGGLNGSSGAAVTRLGG